MSVYFISTNKEKTMQAGNELEKLYGKPADIYECDQIYIAISSAYKAGCIMRSYEDGSVYLIGTIFGSSGFNQDILDLYDSYQGFMDAVKGTEQVFFGHYIIIGTDNRKQCVEVIPDRIGMINTYYASNPSEGYCCSNDIILAAKYSGNHQLCRQAVHEFVLLEANVGVQTIFSGVSRLKLGNGLILQGKSIIEKAIYEYSVEKLSVSQYMERIRQYFMWLGYYGKKIVVDVSGGYDTRLILAIAHTEIKDLIGFSAENSSDNGIDEELSRIITERLGVSYYSMKSYRTIRVTDRDKEVGLHGASAMRDYNNSGKWSHLFRERYSCGDLVLGGYGGEVLRAKYNRYSDLDDFVKQYYKGEEAEKICKFSSFADNIKKELGAYIVPKELDPAHLQNWYYAMAQMRIWGSGFIQMSALYGDVVHPFMDWYLLGPIFGFEPEDLKKAKLQKYIIDFYAPELKDIPINCHMGKGPSLKNRLKALIHNHKCIRNIGTLTYCCLRNLHENRVGGHETVEFPECDQPLDRERIMQKSGKAVRSRMESVVRGAELAR